MSLIALPTIGCVRPLALVLLKILFRHLQRQMRDDRRVVEEEGLVFVFFDKLHQPVRDELRGVLLAGAAAVDPAIGPVAIMLALVLFLWTPSHFWSLAIAKSKDYQRTGIPMLPVIIGNRRCAQVVLVNTLMLVAISILPFFYGMGWIYLLAAAGGGGFIKRVLENEHRATIRIDGKVENVAGVKIAKFASTDDVDIDSTKMSEMYGLSGGGAQINKAKEEFANLLEKLIQLASLQTAFKTLDEALKVTSRRVNALDNVVVPRLENTVNYVKQELDELEREDFTRLKKVVEKKNENEENNELEDGSKYQSESLESSNLGPSILDSYGNNDEADEDLLF